MIPDHITPLLPRDTINTALLKALFAEVQFTTIHHIQFMAVATSTSYHLPQPKSALEEAIHTMLPSATSLQKDIQVVQIVLRDISTTIPSTDNGYTQIRRKVKEFNSGITLHCSPCWLTRPSQRQGQQAFFLFISIAGCQHATQALKCLLLLRRIF